MQKIQIDASTWAELNQLLDAALDQPVRERERWIQTLAPQFDGLKPRLRELLSRAAAVETGDFLNTLPKLDLHPDDLAQPAVRGEQPGDVIRPYRLLRELGSGGMGTVWLAERTDGLINRPVALKLPHGAWKRAGLAERMAREREILATLTHPNIAHLYDAGLTAGGQPFLAIEYVEGRPIDEYCREQPVDLKSRLRLFAQVANAVAYAHSKLVVHRDLKPANILVTAEAQVRLLDFGIAKLMEEGQAKETRLTALSGRALTPDYASPEQILGEPLTIASDVYSLGVILYELLSGQRPYKLRRDSRGSLEDAIVQAEPAQPSDVVDRPWRKLLRGDLDTVVLKALKKKPEERYPTVHALLDDIERYLSARPVLALPDSRWYRTTKFISRNKFAISASGAVLLAVLSGAGVAVWQARMALAEQKRAEEVKDFIASIFRDADPWFGPQTAPSAVDLLKRARLKIEARFQNPTPTRFELMNILGESLMHVQDLDDAAAIEESVVEESRKALGAQHLQTLRAHRLLAQVYRARGDPDRSLVELGKALPALTRRPGDNPEEAVAGLMDQAGLMMDKGRFDEALTTMGRVLALTEALPGDWSAQNVVAWKLLAEGFEYKRDKPKALDAAERAYTLATALYQEKGGHPDLINTRLMYARQLADGGDQVPALALIRESVAEARQLFGPESRAVGEYLQNMAVLLAQAGDLRQARAAGNEAATILARHYEPESSFLGPVYDTNGYVALLSRDGESSLENYEHAYAIVTREYGPANEITQTVRMYRGLALALAGRIPDALRELEAVATGYAKTGFSGMAAPLRSLGEVYRLQGDFEKAAKYLQQSLDALEPGPSSDASRMRVLTELGADLVELGRFTDAVPVLNENGGILAAINCSTATTRITQKEMVSTRLALLREAARRIELELRRYPILAHSVSR